MVSVDDDGSQGKAGAQAALGEAARDPEMLKEYEIASEVFEEDDRRALIDLAWRYQFDDDRSKFKREIREIESNMRRRILAKLEIRK